MAPGTSIPRCGLSDVHALAAVVVLRVLALAGAARLAVAISATTRTGTAEQRVARLIAACQSMTTVGSHGERSDHSRGPDMGRCRTATIALCRPDQSSSSQHSSARSRLVYLCTSSTTVLSLNDFDQVGKRRPGRDLRGRVPVAPSRGRRLAASGGLDDRGELHGAKPRQDVTGEQTGS